jgi:hypothetical protein
MKEHRVRLISKGGDVSLNPKRRVIRDLWRCSCGSEFRSEDDAETHAANANAEASP